MDREEVKKCFIENVEEHSMEIKHDDGVYRHLTFTRNKSNVFRFDLITYPGHLVVSGDMGSYVFQRLEDMFQFFRDGIREDDIVINPGYWGEKLEAVDTNSGYKEFSLSLYRDHVKEMYDSHCEEEDLDEVQRDELWDEIEQELFYYVENEFEAYDKTEGFEASHKFEITDFWEYSCREYTYHYLWILYAIVWGILQYDNR